MVFLKGGESRACEQPKTFIYYLCGRQFDQGPPQDFNALWKKRSG